MIIKSLVLLEHYQMVYSMPIYDLVVNKDFQNNQIGMYMLKHIIKEIGSLSCIHLISTIDNLEFYQRLDLKIENWYGYISR